MAAFRRYADRSSLFVPIADPIPLGRHGRFAVTLTGGGVMLEGDAEVISSSKSPSILHGRVGITLRFSNLDDDSKTVLVELEKARLAAHPAAPSVAPRAAKIPAEPRPSPPAASARIDAASTLAECVAIGDIASLATAAKAASKGPKFVMPAVLPVGSPRPKTPSTPPELRPIGPLPGSAPIPAPSTAAKRSRTPSVQPVMPSLAPLPGSAGIPKPSAVASDNEHTESGPVPIVPSDNEHTESGPVPTSAPSDNEHTKSGPVPIATSAPSDNEHTESGPVPTTARSPASGPIVATTKPRLDITPPRVIPPVARPPTPAPVARPPTPAPIARPPTPAPVARPPTPAPVARPPTPAPVATTRLPTKTPITPAPVVSAAPQASPAQPSVKITMDALDEPTDLTAHPPVAAKEAQRRKQTPLGIAVVSAPPSEDTGRSTPAPEADPLPPGAPTPTTMPAVEEPTPSGDWTMTPGADGPTILPRKPEPPKRPTGDWTIRLDAESPDGWSEPAKPAKPTEAKTDPPELAAVAREVEAILPRPDPSEFDSEQPSIQIDPTLLGPILNPDLADLEDPPIHVPPPPAASTPMAVAPPEPVVPNPATPATPAPGSIPPMATPPPGSIPSAGVVVAPPDAAHAHRPSNRVPTPVPNAVPIMPTPPPDALHVAALMSPRGLVDSGSMFRDSSEVARVTGTGSFPTGDSTSLVRAARKRRAMVIALSAGLVVVIGFVLVFAFGRGGGKSEAQGVADNVPADAARAVNPPVVPIDAAVAKQPPDAKAESAAVEPPPPPVEPPPPPECTVHVTSAPNGTRVLRDNKAIGKTPATLTLPCNEAVKLAFRHARYTSTTRTVTATAEGAKLKVTLRRAMYSIKVSSRPAGARVSYRGRTVAVTPSTMRLPAFERATLTFVKPGYATQTKRVTVRQNHQTVHAKLKRRRRR